MKCFTCARERKNRENFKVWLDYATHTKKFFCPECWIKARRLRQRGFPIRYGLKQSVKPPVKINILRAITIHKYEHKYQQRLKQELRHCERCGAELSPDKLQTHHYRPKSQHGRDEATNYLIVCDACHKAYHKEENKT